MTIGLTRNHQTATRKLIYLCGNSLGFLPLCSWPPPIADPYFRNPSLLSFHSLGFSFSPRANNPARDTKMDPKKTKSKPEVEEAPDIATGWKKCKMSEADVQELEDMKMLQN